MNSKLIDTFKQTADQIAFLDRGYGIGKPDVQSAIEEVYKEINRETPNLNILSAADFGGNIQSAINALGGPGVVRLPNGRYTPEETIILPNGVILEGESVEGTIIDFTSTNGRWGILAEGRIEPLPPLADDLPAFSTHVTFSMPHGLSVGDVFTIWNPTDYSWSPARPVYRQGEMCRVRAVVSDTVVEIETPTYDSYVASEVNVYLNRPVTVAVRNLSLIGKEVGNFSPLNVDIAKDCVFENIKAWGSDFTHIRLSRAYSCVLRGITVSQHSPPIGLNYGITISNSQRIIVSECQLDTTRHSLTIGGGGSEASPINREIIVDSCIIGGRGLGNVLGLDTHGNAEYITFQNNHLLAGVGIGGDHVYVRNNRIRTAEDGRGISLAEMLGANVTIENNDIEVTHDPSQSYEVIAFTDQNSSWKYLTREFSTLRIAHNRIHFRNSEGIGIYIYRQAEISNVGNVDVEIVGNTFSSDKTLTESDTANNVWRGIWLRVLGDVAFRNVTVKDNIMQNCGIALPSNSLKTVVKGNQVFDASSIGIYVHNAEITSVHPNTMLIVEDNIVTNPGSHAITVRGMPEGQSVVIVRRNLSLNASTRENSLSSTERVSIGITHAALAIVTDNIIGDQRETPKQSYALYVGPTVVKLFESANTNVSLETLENSLINAIEHKNQFTSNARLTEGWGSAPPESGYHIRGSIVWNISPSVGEPVGWICVSTGNPGTWKPFATIDE